MRIHWHLRVMIVLLLAITALVPSITFAGHEVFGPRLVPGQGTGQEPITDRNGDLLTEVARFGRGTSAVLAWSLDGQRLAVGGSAGVLLYEATDLTAEPVLLDGHPSRIYSLAYSPDGSILATGSYPTIHLWDASTDEPVAVLTGLSHYAESLTFSPDGATVASGTWDYIRRWDASTGVEQPRWTVHEDPIRAIAYSPDGTQIATGGEDDIIHITDAATGDIIQTLAVHSDTITGLAYSPDGQVLVSASADRMIRLWDANTYEEITTIEDFDNGLRGIAFSRDGAVIVSWSNQGFVRLWDAATYRMLTTVRAEAIAAALSPDGHTLATSTNDHTISLWSLSDDFRDVSLVQQFAVSGHSTGVNAVSFQPDGSGLISCAGTRFSSADATLRLWDTVTGEQQAILAEFSRGATGCAYSPAGDIVAVVLADSISLRDAVSGMELMVLEGHENAITEIAFSPDGARLASASDDTTVRLWDVTSGEQVAVFEDHTQEVKALAVSADGTLLASGGGKYADDEGDFTIRLWDVKTGNLVNSLEGHVSQILSLAFSPDGVSLVSSSHYPDKAIRLWNVAAGSEELVVYSGVVARDMAFAPNGEVLATATDDDLLRLWNTDMWYPLVALNAHPTNLAFNADSSLLATGSADGTIRLWGVPAKE